MELATPVTHMSVEALKKLPVELQYDYVVRNTEPKYIILTQELAQDILDETAEAGFKNRNYSKARVKDYASVIERQAWNPLTGETIAYDVEIIDGKSYRVLTNGQHRVQAVAQGGEAIVVLLVIGIPRESFAELDQGKSRSLVDMAEIHNWFKPNQTVPIAKMYMAYKRSGSPLDKIKRLSTPEIFTILDEMGEREGLEHTVRMHWEFMQIAKKQFNIPYKCMGLLLYSWEKKEPELVQNILKHLEAPKENPIEESPVLQEALHRLANIHMMDKNFIGGSRSITEDFIIQVLALAWAIHTQKIHSCLNREDFDEIMKMYFYDENPEEETLTEWSDIWGYCFKE